MNNPEAPFDGDDWPDWHGKFLRQPPRHKQRRFYWTAIAMTLSFLVLILLLAVMVAALAHIKKRPELDDWLRSLYSHDRGPCCDNAEAETLADPDWRTASEFPGVNGEVCLPSEPRGSESLSQLEARYCVRLQRPADSTQWDWWTVPAAAVVEMSTNKAGPALIWMVWSATGKPYIRCFLAGTMI